MSIDLKSSYAKSIVKRIHENPTKLLSGMEVEAGTKLSEVEFLARTEMMQKDPTSGIPGTPEALKVLRASLAQSYRRRLPQSVIESASEGYTDRVTESTQHFVKEVQKTVAALKKKPVAKKTAKPAATKAKPSAKAPVAKKKKAAR